MDFAAVLKEIETACDDYQTPSTRVAAEQLLLRFRKQPNIVAPCIYIIENTSNYLASFQAASALQECILREWTLHAMQDISSLRNRLMEVIGSRQFPRQSLYALKKLYETVAIIVKRSYLDDDSLMNDTLGQARNLFQSPDTRLRIIAAGILKAILDQFSFAKSTSVGLSYEFHHHCKVKFEKNVLRPCFEWILQELFTNVQNMKQSNPLSAESREYLGKCIEFAEKVMTWNFTPDGEQKVMGTIKRQAKDDEAPDTMDIPESWLDIFTNSDVLNMFFQLHSLLSDDKLFADLHVHTHLSTQILLSFYSTTATCLPDSHIHNYMRSLTQGLIGLFTGLSTNAQSFNWGRNLVGVSEMSHRFIRGFGLERLGGVPEFKDLAGHMLSCTVQVFAMNANDLEDTWCGEAIEEFLAMWSALVNQFQILTSQNPLPVIPNFDYHSFAQELSNISHKIFAAYVESKIQQAILEMDDTDEDETGFKDWDTYSDQLLCITALTRISPKPCLHLLLSHLTDSLNTLSSIFTSLSSPSPPHTQQINPLSEKLQWIIIIGGYVLADKGEGETPLIPDSIKAIFAENDTIVIDIIQRVLQTIQLLINDPNSVQAVYSSPLLFESLWWFITRFIPTYLYFNPSDYYSLPDSLIKSLASPEYVPESTAGNFLTSTLETIELSFKAWNAEIDVVKQLTFALLSMAKTPSIRNQILSHQKFHSLVMFLISSFANFPSDTHSSLIESIFKIVTLSQAPEELKTQYFTAVTGAMEREVTNLVGKNENAGGAGDVERVVNLLEMFNGLALAIDFSNAIPIYNFFVNFFPTFTHLYNTFHSQTILPTYIFQLYSTVVTHITFEQLSHDQWSALCRAVMDSLRIYESTEVRKNRNTKLERDEEVGQDIVAVVKLLANLMAAEFDGADRLERYKSPYAQRPQSHGGTLETILFGIKIIIPLITPEMLTYPTLCINYMRLISSVFEFYPDNLHTLPADFIKSLMFSLEYGITTSNIFEVNKSSFEAVTALSIFTRHEELSKGSSAPMCVWDPYLKRFLECTMELLLMKEYDMELTDYAGEALLALMVCQQTHYTNLVTSLLSSQPNPSIQTRLSNAFTSLTSSMKEPDIIASVMSTRDLAGFKTKLHQFLLQTRGVLMSDVSFGSR